MSNHYPPPRNPPPPPSLSSPPAGPLSYDRRSPADDRYGANRPPPVVKAVALVAVVIGSVALVYDGATLATLTAVPRSYARYGPAYRDYLWGAAAAFAVIAVVQMAAGIGCLNRAGWARQLMVGWAAVYWPVSLIDTVLTVAWVIPALIVPYLATHLGAAGIDSACVLAAVVGGARLILPGVVLVHFRQPRVRAAFAAAA